VKQHSPTAQLVWYDYETQQARTHTMMSSIAWQPYISTRAHRAPRAATPRAARLRSRVSMQARR